MTPSSDEFSYIHTALSMGQEQDNDIYYRQSASPSPGPPDSDTSSDPDLWEQEGILFDDAAPGTLFSTILSGPSYSAISTQLELSAAEEEPPEKTSMAGMGGPALFTRGVVNHVNKAEAPESVASYCNEGAKNL
jgi:hypothetical protein